VPAERREDMSAMSDPQIHHEPGKNWLQRFLARHERQASGDIIAVNIGEGAQNVAVGRFVWQNNVRIGALVVPVRFILVLLAVAAAVAAGVWWAVVPARCAPRRMARI
jgi:hypothetical protein